MKIPGSRIAVFTGAYNHIADGVSLTLNRLVDFLIREGAAVRVYAPTIPVPALSHAGTLVPVKSIQAPGRPDYRVSLGLSRAARDDLTDFHPDLFHIATPDLLGVAALRVARRMGVPVVASYHTHFASYLDYYRLGRLEAAVWGYLRWFYGQCRQVYVPSGSMLEVLREHGVGGELRIWPRGVESLRFHPAKRSLEWRRARGLADDEVVVAFVSRLVAEKGLDVVADVARPLGKSGAAGAAPAGGGQLAASVVTPVDGAGGQAAGAPARMLIVGDGPERGSLQAAIPSGVFAGHLAGDELATAYASADVFLFPSETETFGNVTLEAMASGLPCVVADAPGSSTLVGDGVTGFLCPPRDAAAFSSAVLGLVTDGAKRARMGAAAREAALAYHWEAVLAQIVRYYGEI